MTRAEKPNAPDCSEAPTDRVRLAASSPVHRGPYLAVAGLAMVMWSPLLVAACCHPTRVDRPVIVTAPPCRSTDEPRPHGVPMSMEWARWYAVELVPWIVRVKAECPTAADLRRERKPDPGPAWWTRQPSGAVGE